MVLNSSSDLSRLPRYSFGDGPELADALLALVLSGTKTATCWPVREGHQTAVGLSMVACDSQGRARAVTETVALEQKAFCDIDEEFARKEGEGDGSLRYWREAHQAFFSRNGGFAPDMMLWCEEFVVVSRLPENFAELTKG